MRLTYYSFPNVAICIFTIYCVLTFYSRTIYCVKTLFFLGTPILPHLVVFVKIQCGNIPKKALQKSAVFLQLIFMFIKQAPFIILFSNYHPNYDPNHNHDYN